MFQLKKWFIVSLTLSLLALSALVFLVSRRIQSQPIEGKTDSKISQSTTLPFLSSPPSSPSTEPSSSPVKEVDGSKPAPNQAVKTKSDQAKQASMEADRETMQAHGLEYAYDKLSLPDLIKTYLDQQGIDHSQVAFSYRNLKTGQTYAMNETAPMTAGSTYKLPLNMLVVDAAKEGKLSYDKVYDISQLDYENESEYRAYLSQFPQGMRISDMQEYSLVYSENTPAYALAHILGGFDRFHDLLPRYGQSSAANLPNINKENKTTTDYFIQVLTYLYDHRDQYQDVRHYIGISFENQYYKQLNPDLVIEQKPGYVREALNVSALVYEKEPYAIALYTAGLGGANESTDEVNEIGYSQLIQLCYLINEWHRINMNP